MSTEKLRIFLSYSHEDEKEKEELVEHLSVLRHRGIDLWVDDHLEAGEAWEETLFREIDHTAVAVLLVSEHFLNSEFILSSELPALVRRAEAGELRLFPVIARPCAWRQVPWLARLQVRPKGATPVWSGDAAETGALLAALAEEIAGVVERELAASRSGQGGVVRKKVRSRDDGTERVIRYEAETLRGEFLSLLEDIESGLEEERNLEVFGVETVRRWRQRGARVRERLGREFSLVVIGHFKRGKSTLVNALLGTEVATTDITPETVTINEIRRGESPSVEACLGDGGKVSLGSELPRREALEEALADLPEAVRCLEVRVPSPWLEGVCLVDTPGTGDLFQQFDRQVHDYLSQADAVLYLLSPLSPVSESERNFLQLAVIPQDFAKVTFVVNMLDKIEREGDVHRILELIRHRVLKVLPEAHFFGVSALDEIARQRGEERPRPDRGASLAAGFDALRAHLRESIFGNRDLFQLERAIGEAGAMLGEIEESVETLRLSLSADPSRVRAALASREDEASPENHRSAETFAELTGRIEAMAEEACTWLGEFTDRLAGCFGELDRFAIADLQRHFPFFLTEVLRSAVQQCVDAHRPAILALARESREKLESGARDLLNDPQVGDQLEQTVGQATFGQELWEEFETADLLTQMIGSELFKFGAEALVHYSKSAREKQKLAVFTRKLERTLPQIRESLQEEARKLYRGMAQELSGDLAERRRQVLETSRLALRRARELNPEERERLSVPEILAAVRERVRITRGRLEGLQKKLGMSPEEAAP